MKFACGITLYYPSESDLNNIISLSECFPFIIVYDNTPGGLDDCYRQFLRNNSGIELISNNHNDGLSIAFNIIMNRAREYDFVCLYDQDSRVTEEELNSMILFIENNHDNLKAGIYAPDVRYEGIINKEYDCDYLETDFVISSGSFIETNIYFQSPGFDEHYFIDRIDIDYCDYVRSLGKKIIINNNSKLNQSLGEPTRKFFKRFYQHSSLRNFYIARNRLYYYKKWFGYKGIPLAYFLTLKQVLHVFIFQDDKLEKIGDIMSGIIDYHKGRMGKRLNS